MDTRCFSRRAARPSWTSRLAARCTRPTFFLLTVLTALAVLGFGSRPAQATVYYVATTGSNFNTGLSWAQAFSNLKSTLVAVHSGDQVWVAKGTYVGNFTATDGVAAYGGFAGTETSISQRDIAANPTVLNANNYGTVYTVPSNASGTNTLDGFTLENGTTVSGSSGGALIDTANDTLIVANCTFTNDSNSQYGSDGAGINTDGTSTITNCTFTGNSASNGGGVFAGGNCTITNCTFNSNSGSALDATGNITITGCTFTSNSANNGSGGGVYVSGISTITGCTFTSNTASYGAGIVVFDGPSTITKCMFMDNTATNTGGGVYGTGGYDRTNTITVSDCSFVANKPNSFYSSFTGTSNVPSVIKDCLVIGTGASTTDADGIDIDTLSNNETSFFTISNNTIVETNVGININTTAGAANIANNIFYGNYGGLNTNASNFTITSSHNDNYANLSYNYQGSLLSPTDLTDNPLFVRDPDFTQSPPDDGDEHLTPTSPLIGAGDVNYVGAGDTDLDGNPRLQNGKVGLGCYEAPAVVAATLTSISPEMIQAGHSAFTLTATGAGFVSGATVDWKGVALSTTFVSTTQLTATVPASDVAKAGTASVTVVNPGTAASNAVTFTITSAPPPLIWNAKDVAAATDGTSRLLWTRSDGAAGVWTLNAAGAQSVVGTTYGPYTGWTAKAISVAGDGTTRLLWINTNGMAGVWTLNTMDVETTIGTTYGPYTGWSATDVAASPNGTSRVLWTNTSGAAGVWTMNASDVQQTVGTTYGPYSGWTARAVGAAGDGTARMLWTNANGMAGVWSLNSANVQTSVGMTYGPYAGWTASGLGTSSDGTSNVLWTNVNGAAGVWTFNAAGVETLIGTTYGPYSGYRAAAVSSASDSARVLWVRSDRAAGVWSFGANDVESVIGTLYGPY